MVEGDLNFEQRGLEVLHIAFEHKAALVQQCQLVTGVLQLPQGVGGDDGGRMAIEHILHDQLFDERAHDGVESVKGLVEENVFRAGGKREDDGCLPPHAL